MSTPTPQFTQQEVSMLLDGLEALTTTMTIRELTAKQELLNKLVRLLSSDPPTQT